MKASQKLQLSARRPTPAQATSDTAGKQRLVVWLPEQVHRALKARAALAGKTLQEQVLSILETAGIAPQPASMPDDKSSK